MQRHNVHLTKLQLKILSELQRKTGIAMAEHIRKAVDEYLEKTMAERFNAMGSPSTVPLTGSNIGSIVTATVSFGSEQEGEINNE